MIMISVALVVVGRIVGALSRGSDLQPVNSLHDGGNSRRPSYDDRRRAFRDKTRPGNNQESSVAWWCVAEGGDGGVLGVGRKSGVP